MKHSYIVAQSGSGKSELTKSLILMIKLKWNLFCPKPRLNEKRSIILLDPHGEVSRECAQKQIMYHDYVEQIQKGQTPNLVYISPTLHPLYIPSLNPFDLKGKTLDRMSIEAMAQDLTTVFTAMISSGGWALSAQMKTVLTPVFIVLLMISQASETPCTFHDLERILLAKPGSAEMKRASMIMGTDFFTEKYYFDPRLSGTKFSLLVKLASLLNTKAFKDLLCHPRSTWDLESLMNTGKTIIIDASKAEIGSDVTEVYGRTITALVTSYGYARKRQHNGIKATPCFLIMDEAHTFVSEYIPTILEELRKFGIHLTLVNQRVRQGGTTPEYHYTIMGNTAIKLTGMAGEYTQSTMSKECGIALDEFQKLTTGQFILTPTGKRPTRINAPTAFVGNKCAMSTTSWNTFRDYTLKTYYRPTDEIKPSLSVHSSPAQISPFFTSL